MRSTRRLESLRLNPGQPDARNLLGVIDAQEEKDCPGVLSGVNAFNDVPDYRPARKNLALLDSQNEVVFGRRRPLSSPRRPPSKPSKTSRNNPRRYAKHN